jgi:hypothetical protein
VQGRHGRRTIPRRARGLTRRPQPKSEKIRTRKKIFWFGEDRRGCHSALTTLRGGCGASPSLPAGEGRRAESGPAKVHAAGAGSAACSGRLAGRILECRRGDGTAHSTDPRALNHPPPRSLTGSWSMGRRGPGTRDPGSAGAIPSGRSDVRGSGSARSGAKQCAWKGAPLWGVTGVNPLPGSAAGRRAGAAKAWVVGLSGVARRAVASDPVTTTRGTRRSSSARQA